MVQFRKLMATGLLFLASVVALVSGLMFPGKALAEEANEPAGLDLDAARQYMLTLINKHRATEKLPPVVLDSIAAKAAQQHSDEMAAKGYLGHLDVDGRKPWERYTAAGGSGYVSENTYRSVEGSGSNTFTLNQKAQFTRKELEDAEDELFFEKPPNDGHRKNILQPVHDAVGIGLSKGAAGENQCMTLVQEFTENKGVLQEIPATLDTNPITIKGKLQKGYKFDYLTVEYDQLPKPMTAEELEKLESYPLPARSILTAWPPPYDSDVPVRLNSVDGCDEFSVSITPDKKWEKGIYYFEIWVRDEQNTQFPASCRTVRKVQ